MNRFKVLTPLLLLAAILLLTVAPLSAQDQPERITVAVVVNTSDFRTAGPLIEQWSAETGIQVDLIEENTTTYANSYVLAGVTGSPKIDVIMFWDFYMDQLAPFLTPLDGSYDPAIALSEEDIADFSDVALTPYNGVLYALPYSLDVRLLYYRTDLLEAAGYDRPPETWEELVEYAQNLTVDIDGDGNIDQWGFVTLGLPAQTASPYTFIEFLLQAGGQMFDENGATAFNSPEGIQALQFMVDLRNTYEVMPPDMITYDNNEVHEGFAAGRFAMTNHWPYLWGFILGTEVEDKVGYTVMPYPEGGQTMSTYNAWSFGVPMISENKEAAFDLIRFLTGAEAGQFVFSQMLDWPMRESAYAANEEVTERHSAFSDFVFSVADESSVPTILPRAAETSQILAEEIDQAMIGAVSVEEALNRAEQRFIDLLGQ